MFNKYINIQYYEKFKNYGNLKIGNLEEYRKSEDEALSDDKEGIRNYSNEGEEDYLDQERLDYIQKYSNVVIRSANDKKIFVHNAKGSNVNISMQYPNCYIYCISDGDIEEMKEELDKDSFFTITNMALFNNLLLDGISKRKGKFPAAYLFGEVTYINKKNLKYNRELEKNDVEIIDKSIDVQMIYSAFGNYFTKENRFNNQKEFRFVYYFNEIIENEPQIINIDLNDIKKCISFPE